MPAAMKHHVRAFQRLLDRLHRFLGGRSAPTSGRDQRQALGDARSELDTTFGGRIVQRLRIRIGDDEIDALDRARIMLAMALPPAPPTPIT
jgi:hypothetical protein